MNMRIAGLDVTVGRPIPGTILVLAAALASGVAARQATALQSHAVREALPADTRPLPFNPGEELVFRASVPVFGRIGTGTMRVADATSLRGRDVLMLEFEFNGRAGPFKLSDHTRSWIEPRTLAVHRYIKQERSPIGSRDESVEIYPDERRWTAADGSSGESLTTTPLDELAFLYFVRTLPLRPGDDERFNLHFDPERNPVRVRVLRRDRLSVPAGDFSVVVVEMTVVDPARYGGNGTIQLFLTDDDRRTPVRFISTLPNAGRVTFTLESAIPAPAAPVRNSTTRR
jgi:hypothetical protein